MSMHMAKRVSLSRPWGLNRSPHKIEPLATQSTENEAIGRAGQIDQTLDPSIRSRDASHVAPASNADRPISTVISTFKL